MPPRLQIRVPDTWSFVQHELLDEEPEFDDGVCLNLSEDLLQIKRGSVVIDAGFYRDRYRVVLVRDDDWDHPLRQRDCQHRHEVVSIVEDWSKDENQVA